MPLKNGLCFSKEDKSSFSNESRLRDEVRKENEVLFDPFVVARVSEEAQAISIILDIFCLSVYREENLLCCIFRILFRNSALPLALFPGFSTLKV